MVMRECQILRASSCLIPTDNQWNFNMSLMAEKKYVVDVGC